MEREASDSLPARSLDPALKWAAFLQPFVARSCLSEAEGEKSMHWDLLLVSRGHIPR